MDLWALWGKTTGSADVRVIHPLLCHMVDVAEVTGALWATALQAGLRGRVCAVLGCDEAGARRTLMFWAALHDLGKASPSFQRRHSPAVSALEAQGLSFERRYGGDSGAWHGLISAWALPPLLQKLGASAPLARDLGRALGGHHGSWPPPGFANDLNTDAYGVPEWDLWREAVTERLATLYRPMPLEGRLVARDERQSLVTLIAGLVSVADWLGSMQEHFPATPNASDLHAYAATAAERALQALAAEQWDRWQPPKLPAEFAALFPLTPRPCPMQQTVIALAERLDGPSLVLIEAPTGTGKTEAALYLADHWAHTLQQRGLYVAMPTTATSNQMHGRVAKMLAARYGDDAVSPLLVHGQARWLRQPSTVTQEAVEAGEGSDGVDAMSWFLPLKRSLLAPFGVGTVDQALLSVLLTRHFFVRLFGLAGKTVIFDEVHAYDTYMSAIFARLLGWLRAEGCSVVLLSATLPASTRAALLQAYGAHEVALAGDVSYPAVTWACGEKTGREPLPAPADRSLAIEWLPHGNEHLVGALRNALAEGGCAAVICNTVARAQDVFLALRDAAIVPPDDLTLFHARFPMSWRKDIEERVLARYGKDDKAENRRGIVVATQVIEQSLDLDFDLMVSDLAPIDLLLQRAGRLHRHDRRDRPALVSTPPFLLVTPEDAETLPQFGNDAYVYEPYILLRTWLTLQGRTALKLPSQTEALIEAVYGEDEAKASGAIAKALSKAKDDWAETRLCEQSEAETRLVLPPDSPRLFAATNFELDEDNPGVHAALRALTRLGDQGVDVICLYRHGDNLTLDPEGRMVVDIDALPGHDATVRYVGATVQVSHRGVLPALLKLSVPSAWRSHSLLRYSRLAVFTEGRCTLPGSRYALLLDRQLGLRVTSSERES